MVAAAAGRQLIWLKEVLRHAWVLIEAERVATVRSSTSQCLLSSATERIANVVSVRPGRRSDPDYRLSGISRADERIVRASSGRSLASERVFSTSAFSSHPRRA